jgi:hypothetical protein
VLVEAGVEPLTGERECIELLGRKKGKILGWVYQRIADLAREAGAQPVWIFLPRLGDTVPSNLKKILFSNAREAGFEILDLSGVYEGVSEDEIKIAEFDAHPDARGHRMIEECLYEALKNHPRLRRIARFR